MKVRRYFATSMRSALEMVRQEQGPDVLILSNRKVDDGVELITAEGEIDDALVEKFAKLEKQSKSAEQSTRTNRPTVRQIEKSAPAQPSPAPSEPIESLARRGKIVEDVVDDVLWTDGAVVEKMHQEMSKIKGLLEQQLSGLAWSDFGVRHPIRAQVLRSLSMLGLSPVFARSLANRVPENMDSAAAWGRVLALMCKEIRVLDDPILRHGGTIALCGPTGVGKTTTACKIAAQYAMTYGGDQVAIISTDDRRLGAHQQLKVFSRLSGISVCTLNSGESLSDYLDGLNDRSLIIIDTPGLSAQDSNFRELILKTEDVDFYLTIAANTEFSALQRTMAAIGDLRMHGCVLTKTDEAARLGPALSAIMQADLAIAYVSNGQGVPDDMSPANGRHLVEQAVAMAGDAQVRIDRPTLEQAFAYSS